ncbi:MAG: peptidoglycan-binding protein [Planctomycetes bacterium]|nr:peptidoglycan-binding protein [Planctomycetota bacterium]
MSVREVILMACLVALGVVSYRDHSEASRRQLSALLRRERGLRCDLSALRRKGRALRGEAEALAHDRYYVERVARADLGWRPSPLRDPGLAPPDFPEPASALVQAPPLPLPRLPAPVAPVPAPRPPQPPLPDPRVSQPPPAPPAPVPPPGPLQPVARQALASLGYSSIEHFQSKMMRGRADGFADAATVARAQQLNGLLRRLGYESVKAFQQRNRLTPDGVMGRRTESRALALLRRRVPARPGAFAATSARHRRGG